MRRWRGGPGVVVRADFEDFAASLGRVERNARGAERGSRAGWVDGVATPGTEPSALLRAGLRAEELSASLPRLDFARAPIRVKQLFHTAV
jgi:hypothetical protein